MRKFRPLLRAPVVAAGTAALLLSCAPVLADALVNGLKIKQVDRAYQNAAAAAGVTVAIGQPECGPGEPGFFCSYDAGRGLRLIAGAPTLKSDIDSLAVESAGHEATEALRMLLALTVAVLEPEMPAKRRAEFLGRMIDAIPHGETLLRGDRIDVTFNRFGYGLVLTAEQRAQ